MNKKGIETKEKKKINAKNKLHVQRKLFKASLSIS